MSPQFGARRGTLMSGGGRRAKHMMTGMLLLGRIRRICAFGQERRGPGTAASGSAPRRGGRRPRARDPPGTPRETRACRPRSGMRPATPVKRDVCRNENAAKMSSLSCQLSPARGAGTGDVRRPSRRPPLDTARVSTLVRRLRRFISPLWSYPRHSLSLTARTTSTTSHHARALAHTWTCHALTHTPAIHPIASVTLLVSHVS